MRKYREGALHRRRGGGIMLRCDYCNEIIVEPSEEELKAQLDDVDELEDQPDGADGEGGRRRRKKKKPAPLAPIKRASLVTLPYRRNTNGYDFREYDLCPSCRAKLDKMLDDVRFNFSRAFEEKLYFIVPEGKWEEGTLFQASDVELALQKYNEEACVNVTVDVYLCVYGAYQYEGTYILHEGGYADATY